MGPESLKISSTRERIAGAEEVYMDVLAPSTSQLRVERAWPKRRPSRMEDSGMDRKESRPVEQRLAMTPALHQSPHPVVSATIREGNEGECFHECLAVCETSNWQRMITVRESLVVGS